MRIASLHPGDRLSW